MRGISSLFFTFLFSSNTRNFKSNKCETASVLHTVLGFELTTSPIITRPGLPLYAKNVFKNCKKFYNLDLYFNLHQNEVKFRLETTSEVWPDICWHPQGWMICRLISSNAIRTSGWKMKVFVCCNAAKNTVIRWRYKVSL